VWVAALAVVDWEESCSVADSAVMGLGADWAAADWAVLVAAVRAAAVAGAGEAAAATG